MARHRIKVRRSQKSPRRGRKVAGFPASKKRSRHRATPSTPELEKALRFLRAGNSQKLAAKSAGVSVKRFRDFIRDNRLAKFRKRRWVFSDRRRRQVAAITTRGEKQITVAGFNKASLVMQHRAAVRAFLNLPIPARVSVLKPFEGRSVSDTSGRVHFLETRPNFLLRYASSGPELYQVYKPPT